MLVTVAKNVNSCELFCLNYLLLIINILFLFKEFECLYFTGFWYWKCLYDQRNRKKTNKHKTVQPSMTKSVHSLPSAVLLSSCHVSTSSRRTNTCCIHNYEPICYMSFNFFLQKIEFYNICINYILMYYNFHPIIYALPNNTFGFRSTCS